MKWAVVAMVVAVGLLAIPNPAARADEVEDLFTRGNKALDDGDYDLAITCMNRVLRLDPTQSGAYVTLSSAYGDKGDYDKGIAMANEALARNQTTEDESSAYSNRAYYTFRKSLDNYKKASADYEKALSINPNNTYAMRDYAWMLATHPDAKARDGKKAWKLAKKEYESDPDNGSAMDDLAAAFAECGDFEQAVHWEKKALDTEKGKSNEKWQARLKLYQDGKPYRMTEPE